MPLESINNHKINLKYLKNNSLNINNLKKEKYILKN